MAMHQRTSIKLEIKQVSGSEWKCFANLYIEENDKLIHLKTTCLGRSWDVADINTENEKFRIKWNIGKKFKRRYYADDLDAAISMIEAEVFRGGPLKIRDKIIDEWNDSPEDDAVAGTAS